MYLAIKWLLILGFIMWASLCSIDLLINKFISQGPSMKPAVPARNNYLVKEKTWLGNNQRQSLVFVNYLTFIAGALAVTLYNKKSDIVRSAKQLYLKTELRTNAEKAVLHFKKFGYELGSYYVYGTLKTAVESGVALLKIAKPWWEKIKNIITSAKNKYSMLNENEDEHRKDRNLLLLKRLREVGMERNKLGQLLVIAVRENKTMRLQYHLENLAKKRLMQQIQETQNQIKENRSRYVNFHQVHLMTHQENLYLKSRVKKLVKDKEEAESSLMKLISRVYQSTDNNLKAYCTCFIVKSKENLLVGTANTDVSTFVQKCFNSDTSRPKRSSNKEEDLEKTKSLPSTSISETSQETVIPFAPEKQKPKLIGLPGEYVWTIKDKDGIIEKLYEYDYGYSFDNGDTIRRIREYSVYHDSDCLLDINSRSSTTIFRDCKNPKVPPRSSPRPSTLNVPNRNFLTESPVFQQFMKTNGNFAIAGRKPAPPLLCG